MSLGLVLLVPKTSPKKRAGWLHQPSAWGILTAGRQGRPADTNLSASRIIRVTYTTLEWHVAELARIQGTEANP